MPRATLLLQEKNGCYHKGRAFRKRQSAEPEEDVQVGFWRLHRFDSPPHAAPDAETGR
jgi:hypothetical protein